jgi:glutamine synthetase
MTVINLIVADQLKKFKVAVDALIKGGMKKDDAIFNVLKDYIKASKNVRFEGDGYSDAWKEEAAKRGLKNTPDTPRALDFYVTPEAQALFAEHGVLSHVELEARYEILQEEYYKKIQIESRTLSDLVKNHIVPTAIEYQSILSQNVMRLKEVLPAESFQRLSKEQVDMIIEISERISKVLSQAEEMTEARKAANNIADTRERALAYCDNVKPFFDSIRYEVDKLELLVDNEMWPLPKYREMLYIR